MAKKVVALTLFLSCLSRAAAAATAAVRDGLSHLFIISQNAGFPRRHYAPAVCASPPRRLAPGRCPDGAGLFDVGGALAEVCARSIVEGAAID